MQKKSQTNRGTTASEYAPVPHILTRKDDAPNHVVVGMEPLQVRFLAHVLGLEPVSCAKITDDLLAGRSNLLLHVNASYCIDISPDTKTRTAIWSADTLVKGSSAMRTLLRYANTLTNPEKKATTEQLDQVSAIVLKRKYQDLRALIWDAAYLLDGEIPVWKKWSDPWENASGWMDASMDPEVRLGHLFKRLTQYCTVRYMHDPAMQRLGISKEQTEFYKKLYLDPTKVAITLRLLSRWKQGRLLPYICAIHITTAWMPY